VATVDFPGVVKLALTFFAKSLACHGAGAHATWLLILHAVRDGPPVVNHADQQELAKGEDDAE
jgi:hypothetical protein